MQPETQMLFNVHDVQIVNKYMSKINEYKADYIKFNMEVQPLSSHQILAYAMIMPCQHNRQK